MRRVNVKITFLSKENGGRSQAIPVMDFGCPVYFEDIPELSEHAYDCRLLISGYGKSISPGDTVEDLKMIFLSPDEVISHLQKGTRFTLWEGKTIAQGEVVSIE
jgi:hypothetical protein